MPKKKVAADSDAESSDDSELHEVRNVPTKVSAVSSRPRRATAGAAMQKLTAKLLKEDDDDDSEDEFPVIPKATLNK